MIFWRTHWAWSCDAQQWNPLTQSWDWIFTHYGDYETAFAKYDKLRALPPGSVRNIKVNRRAVGAPMNFLGSS